MAGLCAPLSTLRRHPRGYWSMTRGQCGSLHLHCERLALSTPCRSSRRTRNHEKNTERTCRRVRHTVVEWSSVFCPEILTCGRQIGQDNYRTKRWRLVTLVGPHCRGASGGATPLQLRTIGRGTRPIERDVFG